METREAALTDGTPHWKYRLTPRDIWSAEDYETEAAAWRARQNLLAPYLK